VALKAAQHALPSYAHRFSPKTFTQPQLFACLALKTFYYRPESVGDESPAFLSPSSPS
jgi:hypothetical protein